MPDLSPDTSIYSTIAKSSQSGLGSMDLGSLLGLVGRSRQLQTQQAISDALKGSIDPNTGQPNASSAISGLVHSPAMIGSDDITHLNAMQHQQAQTRAFNTEQAGKAAAAFYNETLAGTATPEKAHSLIAMMSGWGTPPDQLAQFEHMLITPDGKVNKQGALELAGIASGGAALPTMPMQLPSGVTGSVPAQAAQAGPGGFVPTAIPGAAGPPEASSKRLVEARDAALNYNQETYPLRATIHALEALPEQGTGEGTEAVNKIKNFLGVIGADKSLGIDLNNVSNYEQAKKYMIQWANSVSATGTNDRLSAAIAGNPNMTLLKSTNETIAKTALALRRIQQVQLDEFERSGQPPSQYAQWAAQWNKTQDPRAYAFDIMGKDNAAKLLKSMAPNSPERQRFDASLSAARRSGLAEGNL